MNHSPIEPPVHEQASLWASRLHSGNCSPAERRAFQDWLEQNEEHRRIYRDIEALWRDLGDIGTVAGPQVAAARAYLQKSRRRRPGRARRLALAASVLLPVIAFPYAWTWLHTETYRTEKGGHARIELADGSHIELNTDTELRVNYSWSSRTVTLDRGEALFSVVHDAGRPFQVLAAGGCIRDIGTRFDVYRQTDRVSVTVLEGEVEVTWGNGAAMRNVSPGQRLSYDHSGQPTELAQVDAEDVVAWREGRLVFKGESLGRVLEHLGRYHDVVLQAQDPQLQSLKVSGTFPTNDLKLALDAMAGALPIKISRIDAHHVMLESVGKGTKR